MKNSIGGCRYQQTIASGKFARPGSKPSYAPDQNFDTEHILLDLTLDVPKKTLRGKCTTSFRALIEDVKEIVFHAERMKILSIRDNSGKKLKYTYKKNLITIQFSKILQENESASITVEYSIVNPIAGIYFIEPDRWYPKKPVQIWTHGEAEESRYWFPCFDAPHDKATTEMLATVPSDFFALSNGALLGVKDDSINKTKTYHWKQSIPHSPYLVTLVAGKFSEIKDEWDGIPILYYCQPGREEDVKRAFGKTPKMVQFFSDAIGVKYPFEKYAQIAVADFVMGGMEHTTATTQTDRVLMDAKAYPEFTADWLVSHELAHQWFGDLLTCKEWSHAWLNESFATYFEALFTEHNLGKDEFEYEMYDKLKIYLDEDKNVYRRPIVTNVYRRPDDLFDRHLYEKGAVVLHMLRHFLGDKLFWKAIHHYVSTYQGQAVETADLIHSIQQSTGKNMRRFFDQWVFGAGYPEYTVHYWWNAPEKKAHVRILQKPVNNNTFFHMPVELEFVTAAGKKKHTETIENKKHEFSYKFSAEPLDFRFDPEFKILKTTEISKPCRMWEKQLATDPHAVARALAAKEIAKIVCEESVQILIEAFQKEKFWGTAKEIAMALGSTRLESARQFLARAVKTTKNPKARRGVAESLANFSGPHTEALLESVFERDASYFVSAEALKSLSKTRGLKALAMIRKALQKESWNDVIRSTAVSACSEIASQESQRWTQKYSKYGHHPSTRASAIQSMTKYARKFTQLFDDLVKLTEDRQVRVKHAAITALGNLREPRAIPILEKIAKDKNLPYRTSSLAQDAILKIDPSKENH